MKITGNPPKWAVEFVEIVNETFGRSPRTEFVWKETKPRVRFYEANVNGATRRAVYQRTLVSRGVPKQAIRPVFAPTSKYSSGTAWPGLRRVVVRVGTDVADQRFVLAHEMAHIISPASEGHGDVFAANLHAILALFPNRAGKATYAMKRGGNGTRSMQRPENRARGREIAAARRADALAALAKRGRKIK